MTVQIFVSYARDDDLPPPGRDELNGFVTYLDEQLRFALTDLGQPRPHLWRDTRNVERGNQFEPRIEAAIEASALFMVVLSRNWLDRPWCQRELASFRRRWSGEDDDAVKRRIIVAAKHAVREFEIPPLLRGQEGYCFFHLDPEGTPGQEREFFGRGRILDPRFETRADELARYLWRAAARLEGSDREPRERRDRLLTGRSTGRTVYLAKPASDMRLAYDRLVKELLGAGYAVLPTTETDIPLDDTATAFVDAALAAAEVSVHLLGERRGPAPDNADPVPLAPLQLQRAAARAAGGGFRRIVWAPRFLTGEGAEAPAERDPLMVLDRLDRQLDGDAVIGDNLSKFVEFLIQHLDRKGPAPPEPPAKGSRVYIYHRSEDEAYAIDLAVALREGELNPVLTATEGESAQLDALHRRRLLECQAVVLCWGHAPQVWALANCCELRDWKLLGRQEKFAVRVLVAGPPPNGHKDGMIKVPPADEIDVVLDLTGHPKPLLEALGPLIRAAAPAP